MNILLVENLQLAPFFQKLGHNVVTCSYIPSADFQVSSNNCSLIDICNSEKIDVLIQTESLSRRIIITDIDKINILKVYYAIDIHLNYFWQKEYRDYFDIFISSQKNFLFEEVKVMHNQHKFYIKDTLLKFQHHLL
jgi:hypothetical protein